MSATDDLPCQELVELVTDYLENRLPNSTRARFETHRALGRLPAESIEPDARDRLLEVFRDWKRRSA